MDIKVTDGGYPYTIPENFEGSFSAALGGIVALVGQRLLTLGKELSELTEDQDEFSVYQYHDNVTVSGILLEMDGIPLGIVHLLDDYPQFTEFRQGPKITEESENV